MLKNMMVENLFLAEVILKLATIPEDLRLNSILSILLQIAIEIANTEKDTPGFRQMVEKRREMHRKILLIPQNWATVSSGFAGLSVKFLDVSTIV